MRVCRVCLIEKSESEFHTRQARLDTQCKQCSLDYVRKWRSENRERNAANSRTWAKINPEKSRLSARLSAKKCSAANTERARDWAKKNLDRVRETAARWVRENPAKSNANTARYRAAKIRATPGWANQFYINELYDLAALRTAMTGFRWEVDHVIPLRGRTVSGLHTDANLQVIPKLENMRKGNRLLAEAESLLKDLGVS